MLEQQILRDARDFDIVNGMIEENCKNWDGADEYQHRSSDFSDDEYVDAAKTFFANLGYWSEKLAETSAFNLAKIQLNAAIENDTVTEFVAECAHHLLSEKRKREERNTI